MLEIAVKYYSRTADAIRDNFKAGDKQNELFSQLLVEEVLLYYKIIKMKGLHYKKMLEYYQLAIDKLS